MELSEITANLPYEKPFLFVDEIISADKKGITGKYYFDPELDFYKGHFRNNPVTPGVILTECMAQIGLVSYGIYLLRSEFNLNSKIALTSTEMEFLLPVFPGETVTVYSEMIYFRFNKLKCKVVMKNSAGLEVCTGEIAGILIA